jgi:hypothetical protein
MSTPRRRTLLVLAIGSLAALGPVGWADAACSPRPLPLCNRVAFTGSVRARSSRCVHQPPTCPNRRGPRGPRGANGSRGIPGVEGITGAIGPQGPVGPAGAQGATGPKGTSGAEGASGPKGTPGAEGVAGPRGLEGVHGEIGAPGATGPKGTTGSEGGIGPKGTTGVEGAEGVGGPKGVHGETGASGVAGPAGSTGPAGATGPAGSGGLSQYAYVYGHRAKPDRVVCQRSCCSRLGLRLRRRHPAEHWPDDRRRSRGRCSDGQEFHVECSARTGDADRRNAGQYERLCGDREARIAMQRDPVTFATKLAEGVA